MANQGLGKSVGMVYRENNCSHTDKHPPRERPEIPFPFPGDLKLVPAYELFPQTGS